MQLVFARNISWLFQVHVNLVCNQGKHSVVKTTNQLLQCTREQDMGPVATCTLNALSGSDSLEGGWLAGIPEYLKAQGSMLQVLQHA